MKQLKTALLYGSISGAIMTSGWWLFGMVLGDDLSMGQQELLGYSAMLLALSAVFVGVKKYRGTLKETKFTFIQALSIGLQIVLVASAIYVIGWMIYYPLYMPDFYDNWTAGQLQAVDASGLPVEEIQVKKAEIKAELELYKNPVYLVFLTFMEIFPIGLVISVASALILKRK